MATLARAENAAENFIELFNSKFFLIVMTLMIAMCSSSFAFDYGLNFDKRYGILFGIALAALTFHYSKYLPQSVLKLMGFYTIVGLIILTMFVAAAAWLATATTKTNPETVAKQKSIDMLESQIRNKNREIAALVASGNPLNARYVSQEKTLLENQLNEKSTEMETLSRKSGRYQAGAMAIFGHLQVLLGWSQEAINMIFMGYILSVLICMELTMGAAIHSKK